MAGRYERLIPNPESADPAGDPGAEWRERYMEQAEHAGQTIVWAQRFIKRLDQQATLHGDQVVPSLRVLLIIVEEQGAGGQNAALWSDDKIRAANAADASWQVAAELAECGLCGEDKPVDARWLCHTCAVSTAVEHLLEG